MHTRAHTHTHTHRCKKALAELQDEQKRAFYVEMMDAARLEAERELKKKKREQREKTKANKKGKSTQCVAVCCNVLQCVAMCCDVL